MPALARMRIQLQCQRGGQTIHFGSIVLVAKDDLGVKAEDVVEALRRLRDHTAIPSGEEQRADAALARAVRWVEARPPNGVSGRFSKSFYFAPETPRVSWRFDIEGMQGVHLLR
jgi:hypothetical protein